MTEVKFKKTTSTDLDSVQVSDGQIVAVTDTGELHIDFDGARTKYGGGSEVDLSKNSVRIGEETVSFTDSVVVGYGASTAYSGGVAVGKEATVMSQYALALGNQAKVDTNADFAISIGDKAKATHEGAIQLGFGNSKENYSLSVGLGYTDSENHLLLRSDGFIPDERLSGNISRSDHTHDAYALKSEIPDTDNFVTQIQAEESYAPLIHSHSGYATLGSLTAVGETASEAKENADSALAKIEELEIPDTSTLVKYTDIRDESTNSILIGNLEDEPVGSYNVVIGNSTSTGTSTHEGFVTVLGNAARGLRPYAVAIGDEAHATSDYTTCVGTKSNAASQNATALGYNARAVSTYSIQLGYGSNSTANTFSVGLSALNNYRLLNSDGKIPIERIPDGVGGISWADNSPVLDTEVSGVELKHRVNWYIDPLVSIDFTDTTVGGGEVYMLAGEIIHFHSGTTATAVTCGNVKFIGLHCYAGTFTPQKKYLLYCYSLLERRSICW